MSTSVSSEWAFSQGGITITKRQNRLKGDIVEALQCVKCAIRYDLLFREPGPSSILEEEYEEHRQAEVSEVLEGDISSGIQEQNTKEESSWYDMLIGDDDDDEIDFLDDNITIVE